MTRRRATLGMIVFCTLGAVVSTARAGLVVAIGGTTVSQGGTGSITVDISNTGNSSIEINDFAIQLVITPSAGTLTQLAFAAPTAAQLGYLTDSSLTPGYIFLNNSFDAVPPAYIGAPGETVFSNDTFNATDSTADGNPVTIDAGKTELLAILPFTTLTQLDAKAGDSFTVGLVPGSGSGSIADSSATYFDVIDFDESSPTFGEELSATSYTSTPGTVEVKGASAVPEPGSIISGLTATLIGTAIAIIRRIRRRSASSITPRG